MRISKETVKRAIRTFAQAAIGYIAVNVAVIDVSSGREVVKTACLGLAISAIAAGISAVMNLEE